MSSQPGAGGDTDLLLVLLETSLPEGLAVQREELLEALILADGDVQKAAEALTDAWTRSAASSTATTSAPTPKVGSPLTKDAVTSKPRSKRKAETGLDGWVKNARPRVVSDGDNESKPPRSWRDRSASLVQMNDNAVAGPSASSKPRSKREGTPPPSLMNFLRDTSPVKPPSASATRLPPLMLMTPEMVAKHTPTTLHPSILPAEVACQLYYEMLDESKTWPSHKWYMNDRLVESSHIASFYARSNSQALKEASLYWYNGRHGAARAFPALLETALQHIEPIVRREMRKRARFPLEWGGGEWAANVCAANCYRGSKEGVGAHADHITYLGPYPTIASLSLGTTRNFRLREVIPMGERSTRQAQTFDVPLSHNTLLIMHPPTQERFKHSIPTVKSIDSFRPGFARDGAPCDAATGTTFNERINITFRFFRPDYRPVTIPTCTCVDERGEKIPAVLRSNMKRRGGSEEADFFWQCNGAAQKKGCKMWRAMDVREEGRGPFVVA